MNTSAVTWYCTSGLIIIILGYVLYCAVTQWQASRPVQPYIRIVVCTALVGIAAVTTLVPSPPLWLTLWLTLVGSAALQYGLMLSYFVIRYSVSGNNAPMRHSPIFTTTVLLSTASIILLGVSGQQIFLVTPPTAAPPARTRPATPEEAEQRFWRRYGPEVLNLLLGPTETPTTVAEWYTLAGSLAELLDAPPLERSALLIERLARELREGAKPNADAETLPEDRA